MNTTADQTLDFYALDDDVAVLQAHIDAASVPELPKLVALAWHLRQRNCSKALALADQAQALSSLELPSLQRTLFSARLVLVRAEVQYLFADLDSAFALADSALNTFMGAGDLQGVGDAHWTLALIWADRGNRLLGTEQVSAARVAFESGADPVRIQLARARNLALLAFSDAKAVAARLATEFPLDTEYPIPVLAVVTVARGNVAGLTNDPGASLKFDLQANELSSNSGQMRQAIVCAVNAAETFGLLGDLDAALEWSERALSMARANAWPGSVGVCLMQVADVLRQLKRYNEAQLMLFEAHRVMEALAGSRNQEQVLAIHGQLALDMGDFPVAMDFFQQLEKSLIDVAEPDLLLRAWRGQAKALAGLGQLLESVAKATQALELAQASGNTDEQIKTLGVLAEVHSQHALPLPLGVQATSAALYFLVQALDVSHGVAGYTLSTELLSQIADAYAAAKDFENAYNYLQEATTARNQTRIEEAQSRALAMQIRHDMDLARADSEQHRKLSVALQETNETLETLGLIGREITASLDINAIYAALHQHIGQLLDMQSFSVYLLDPTAQQLDLSFGIEGGQPMPTTSLLIDSPNSLAARCARERREVVVNAAPEATQSTTIPGTLVTRSMLFAPLVVGHRLLGVITIQSVREQAYAERECSIFRTLSAYGAIALDNSSAYNAVEAARRQSAQQQQELRIAAVAFDSNEGLLITDADLVILRINSSFTRITGFQSYEVVGRETSIFRSPLSSPVKLENIMAGLQTSGDWQGELWIRSKSSDAIPLWLSVTAVRTEDGLATHYVMSLVDITERKQAEDEIRNLAFFDPLTNLPNRRLLMDRLAHALAQSERNGNSGALVFIDLDNFKKLNDTRGHDVGDLLLIEVARRLSNCLRESDTAARLGGDEFVILLENMGRSVPETADRTRLVGEKLHSALNTPYNLDGQEHHSTPSIGICLFQGNSETIDDLLKQADLAMYQSKASGRNAIRFFDPAMQQAVTAHATLEADLREGLLHKQFLVYYQVQVDSSRRVLGAEALVRWRHPSRGMVSPAEFIPLAEESGLIIPLGHSVLETACHQLKHWESDAATEHLTLAVNISARQFHSNDFVASVLELLRVTGANPHRLKLELTESMLINDLDRVIVTMKELIAVGVRFSLDDFGTGYSSLSYLKRLPLGQLKIDQSFVRDIFVDHHDLAIVRAIVTLGHSLGLEVIAEGVETRQQLEFLQECGCEAFQGYLFAKPLPVDELDLLQI